MKKVLKWVAIVCIAPFALIFVIALGMSIYDHVTTPPEVRAEAKAAKDAESRERFAADRARRQALTAQKAEEERMANDALPLVTAQELARAYDANEIAADKKYKGTRYRLTGVVAEISTTVTGAPSLRFPGGVNRFMDPLAVLYRSEERRASQLRRGQRVTLICTGTGVTLGTPMSGNCTFH